MSCSCEHMAQGFKSMVAQRVLRGLSLALYRMQSCSQATGTRGISLLYILGDLPGKLWMVARLWAMPRMQPILQPRIRMALTGYCSLPNRRQAMVCLVGS